MGEVAVATGTPRLLTEVVAKEWLGTQGIPVVPTQLARSPSEAARLAKRLGLPAALKIVSADIVHKSDIGGVRLQLTSFSRVNKAYGDIIAVGRSRLPQALHGCS